MLWCRSSHDSLFKIGLLSNQPMLGVVLLTFILQIAVIYWQPMQTLFVTHPLSLLEFGIALGAITIILFAIEIEKWFSRRALPIGQAN
jgi:Ca2+-transporting ATPase